MEDRKLEEILRKLGQEEIHPSAALVEQTRRKLRPIGNMAMAIGGYIVFNLCILLMGLLFLMRYFSTLQMIMFIFAFIIASNLLIIVICIFQKPIGRFFMEIELDRLEPIKEMR